MYPVCTVRRSEEHTSELQSRGHLVCRLLLEKKKKNVRQVIQFKITFKGEIALVFVLIVGIGLSALPLPYFFFFFNDTATTEIYTLSLHDALPISSTSSTRFRPSRPRCGATKCC